MNIKELPAWPWRAVVALAILIGIVWRLAEFLSMASLAADEVAVARNILGRDALGLIHRLDYGQVAPIGFLLSVKACSLVFGSSEWSLRLVPFVCGLAVLPLFWVVARRILDEPAALAATALVSLAAPVALWSTVLKQYSSDVFCALAALALGQWALSRSLSRKDVALALVAGACIAIFSQGALMVLASSGAVLVAEAVRGRRSDLLSRIGVVAGWCFLVVSAVLWSRHIMRPVDYLYMRRFWGPLFMPMDLRDAGAWLWQRALTTFSDAPWPNGSLMYERPKLWFVLAACGVLAVLSRSPRQGFLLTGPILLAVLASAMKEYPLGGRTGLFLLPLLIILVVAGTQSIGSLAGRRMAPFAPMVLIPFAAVFLFRFPPSFMPEHLRPDFEYLSSRLQPGDTIWVYYAAAPAFEYYATRIPMEGTVTLGLCDRTDPRANLYQIDQVRGRHRVWIVLTHIDRNEREVLLGYLDLIGTLQETHSTGSRKSAPTASAVYLYQLDEPTKLNQASARDFPVTPIEDPSAWSCYGGFSLKPGSDAAAVAALQHESN